MIVAIFAGVTLLTIIRVLMETPLYTAQSTILIKPGTPQIFGTQVLGGDNSESGDQSDFYENYNKTQYEILKSRSLAVSAIKGDGLEKTLTSGGGKSPGLISSARTAVGHFFKGIFGRSSGKKSLPVSHSARESEDGVSGAAIGAYMSGLSIKPVTDTNLVNIVFTTPDGELSARLANAHAHAYIRQGIELHSQANEEAQKFLEQKLVDLKEKLQKSEYALNRYRRDQGIVPGLMSLDGKETIVLDRLTELSKGLTDAQVARLEIEAQGAADSQSSVRRAAARSMRTRCWPICVRATTRCRPSMPGWRSSSSPTIHHWPSSRRKETRCNARWTRKLIA